MGLNQVTPQEIKHLRANEVFVFGSNKGGLHAGGAARQAVQWGAVFGKGVGYSGNTYAIQTLEGHGWGTKTPHIGGPLPLSEIKRYVDEFTEFTHVLSWGHFLVTPIGCGIAGFTPEEIAPLFRVASLRPNVWLPGSFWVVLDGS